MKVAIPKNYIHGRDNRSQEQIQIEGKQISQICSLNEQLFKPLVEQESQKQIQKFKNNDLEMKLSGGRYLYYTDRTSFLSEEDKSNSKLPIILTVHGIPGTLQDFLSMQQNLQSRLSCRWINFSVPGLDGKDERRGTYQGYLEDTSLLIKDFLDELKIDKVILIMHSAGGLYGKYFMYQYPDRVRASVQAASIGIEMWAPLLQENLFFKQFGIDVLKITREEVDTQQFRDQFTRQMEQLVKSFENKQDKNNNLWKAIPIYQHLMLLKAQLLKGGFDQFFANIKNIDKRIPRFFAFSQKDSLLEERHIQQEIYHSILSQQSFDFRLKEDSNFDQIFKLRDKQNLLNNFIFSYHDAGHGVQHVKAFDISIKLMIFIKLLDHMQTFKKTENNTLLKPNL
ncbi:alpha/beta fold hydrolase (macronuclear) [Tetrahymena thermophila SB210]|uniref:Alpha/beta fold hydrolase n=1 Tax=Tetrahymena thermophila (strain SB210) TaxID=312017 RepID=I7LUN0_TETTS|nr:alpha/beta fold hydrolase [Tetrahymena thermophila SB210]EAR95002.1 alpha/beta fold hydrolase [Tetrahymena thermophila SB210]|eukprot:XP_001015247.1 alpha/beta fold hydrolase [Tetrahymena thermophila SB210]